MKAFTLLVNGKRLCTAGIGDNGVLTAIVNWVGGDGMGPDGRCYMHLGGLDSNTQEYLDYTVPELRLGDEVTIKIIEADQIDPPAGRRKQSVEPID